MSPPPLTARDGERLLRLARRALEQFLESGVTLEASPDAPVASVGGVFVTLKRKGKLRGCVGLLEPDDPLPRAVIHCCLAAATEDPRFPRVRPEEIPDLNLEISVLSACTPVGSVEEIEVGRDGLLVEQAEKRGLLLPQVPRELGWDRTRFLEGVCRKAGLPPDAWSRSGTVLQRFTSQVFQE